MTQFGIEIGALIGILTAMFVGPAIAIGFLLARKELRRATRLANAATRCPASRRRIAVEVTDSTFDEFEAMTRLWADIDIDSTKV